MDTPYLYIKNPATGHPVHRRKALQPADSRIFNYAWGRYTTRVKGVTYTPYPANPFLTARFQDISDVRIRIYVLEIIHHLPETTHKTENDKNDSITSGIEGIKRSLFSRFVELNKAILQVETEAFLRPLSKMYEDCGEHEQAQTLNIYREKLKYSPPAAHNAARFPHQANRD